jgi:tRNA threonylcarbamoyladenosine biosynthesis protein TsaB
MSCSLIIDTAFETCQVGLVRDGKIVAEDKITSGGGHDRVLATMMETLFKQNEITAKDIDTIFVTTGPGRFTGLRVGIAFARGLGLVNKAKLVGVNTLDAIAVDAAHAYPSERKFCAIYPS